MAASINDKQIIPTIEKSDAAHPPISDDDKQKNKRSFGGRLASVFIMVIPHIVTHIGLGAAKGLEVGATRPADFLNRHCTRIGTKGRALSNVCGIVGTTVGSIIGAITVVPGLLIGTVVGIGRSIYKFPKAVKTCWGDGTGAALSQTVESYKIDPCRVGVAVGTTLVGAAISCAIVVTAGVAAPLFVAMGVACVVGCYYTLPSLDEEQTSEKHVALEAEPDTEPKTIQYENGNMDTRM